MRYAVLVYQAGIANVFEVERQSYSPDGRNARRMLQHAFDACEWYARGLAAAGWQVMTAGCNQAGDVARAEWTSDLDSLPFSNKFRPVSSAA